MLCIVDAHAATPAASVPAATQLAGQSPQHEAADYPRGHRLSFDLALRRFWHRQIREVGAKWFVQPGLGRRRDGRQKMRTVLQ